MSKYVYTIRSEVWIYPGMAGWHFMSLPKEQGEEIKKKFKTKTRGWGSLPVTVSIGKTQWNTSIFPDKKSGTYLLPLKAEVRTKVGIRKGDFVDFSLTVQV